MKKFAATFLLLLLAAFSTRGDEFQPPKDAKAPDPKVAAAADVAPNGTVIVVTADGQKFKTVPRNQLRVKAHGTRSLTVPRHFKGLLATIPVPPATYDWTKGNTVAFPVLGNNQVGDCFYAAGCHMVQCWNANARTPVIFIEADVIRRYRKLSGGDNGLSDSDMLPEMKGGLLGPSGPHKILDYMIVNPTDVQAIALAQWAFGSTMYTCSLCNEWLRNPSPGQLWDRGTPNPNAGHAILLTGKNAKGNYSLQTWGFNPPIELTQAGLESAEPEIIACFSMEWFDADTGKAPNGLSYTDAANLWVTLGGHQLPPSPFPGPGPIVPPVPPTPPTPPNPPVPPIPGTGFTGSLNYSNGTLVSVTALPTGGFEADLKAAGISPAVIGDVVQLIADLKAKAGLKVYFADLMKIMTDLSVADRGGIRPADKFDRFNGIDQYAKLEDHWNLAI